LYERLAGRRQGADHYLAKPVQIDELVLVVRSLARRITARAPAAWTVSPQRLQLQAPSGATVAITQSESALLAALARAPQRQCSRRALAQALGESWEAYDERRLEALVSRLRRKLADGCGCEAPLRTLRGSGYGFVEPLQLG
jgi:DNA-binding response OmpR family regulator